MPIEIGMTRENASAWLMGATYAAASTRRISSVAYAVEESASDEKTAKAVFLVSRSCVKRSVLIGLPTSKRFNEAIFSLRQQAHAYVGRAKKCHSVQLCEKRRLWRSAPIGGPAASFGLTSRSSLSRAVY